MARIAGRNARLYMGITSGGTAEPVAFIAETDIDMTADKMEVTAWGDVTKTYVPGLPDFSGSFAGFFDNATPQMYTAAVDGVARKFYWYPDVQSTPTMYWFGTAFFDFHIKSSVGGTTDISGNISAAGPIAKNP